VAQNKPGSCLGATNERILWDEEKHSGGWLFQKVRGGGLLGGKVMTEGRRFGARKAGSLE